MSSNIPRYFIYTALKGFSFGLFAALWVIYLQEQRGLDLAQAALVDVTFFVAAAVGEVPTGMVADTWGRKTSLAIGCAMMAASSVGWVMAPGLPLIVVSYVGLGIGFTFVSGADEALFYESIQRAGRGTDYTRLLGRAGATMTASLALGSVASGLLGSVGLAVPFLVSAGCNLAMLLVVTTLQEPSGQGVDEDGGRQAFGTAVRQSMGYLRAQPAVRYLLIYLAVVPLAAFIMETLFVQPQAIELGLPVAGVGFVVMGLQMASMAGAVWSDRLARRVGEAGLVYGVPVLVVISLALLAAFQIPASLLFVAAISLLTALQQPIVINHIQAQVTDTVRATLLSVQSLMATALAAIAQPALGLIADLNGLPATYLSLSCFLALASLVLWWRSRRHFPALVARP